MTFLCTPNWIQAEDFRVNRGTTQVFVIGWQPSVIVSWGQTTVLRETVFGGFEFHMKFSDAYWNWSSRFFHFREIFDDLYATFPGGSPIVSAGTVAFRWNIADPLKNFGTVVDMGSVLPTYWFFPLPAQDPLYWARSAFPLPPMPFVYVP